MVLEAPGNPPDETESNQDRGHAHFGSAEHIRGDMAKENGLEAVGLCVAPVGGQDANDIVYAVVCGAGVSVQNSGMCGVRRTGDVPIDGHVLQFEDMWMMKAFGKQARRRGACASKRGVSTG